MGARYTVHWKVGSVPIGGVIEVVEFDPPRELSWVGLTGVSQRGRFRLRDTATAAPRSLSDWRTNLPATCSA